MDRTRRISLGPDLVFALIVASSLLASSNWLNDPGTPWHLRLGREIVATGLVPRADTLTYPTAGAKWVDQSWLFDVGLAWVVDGGGWSLAVVVACLSMGWLYRLLTIWQEADGVSPLAAVTTSILAAGVGSVHFLVRPHLITFGMAAWTFHACRVHHLRGGRLLWTLPPLMIVWANCHGGFLAGPIIVATATAAQMLATPRDRAWKARLRELAQVLLLMSAATLCTPYGLDLHRHVIRLLMTSGVTDLIEEYQPTPFGKPQARLFEWVVLALVALPSLTGKRIGRYDLCQGLVWLHFALGSVRQTPLLAFAIVLPLGHLCDGALGRIEAADWVKPRGDRPWFGLIISLGLLGLVATGWSPARFKQGHWPLEGFKVLNSQPAGDRIFHEQDWGGFIEAEARPTRRAFLDDRFELVGRQGVIDYLAMMEGGPGWDAQERARDFDLVWVRPDRGLAQRLAADPSWRTIHRDEVSVLFRRLR